ncbi:MULTISPECIES: LLM class flavin-dependent oxidoreductase [Rhodanobacter]|uniref:LLM class flavin-dependent oxidoreductase n=1 Tax=Rhodanobacter TaxID=75309 RepID=UPI00040FAF93|nr:MULTISPECIES: LLM class flavin-dependent oxidoreductase [Rhodanobacter]TAN19257.1 MAG: LLM class flavin-dependent oxidoreductase [Rhodanobacter sp.]UJJ53849.1 LLM class flavin-dependent oxidoreductase [Rhodanobacter thiooxydans]
MIPFSILDLAPVTEGSDAGQAFRNTLDLARLAERLGYHRYWLAEHHNMPGIASAATAVLIGHVAGGTSTIRVGAGGIMLPNHAPLQVAEAFGTLASLYPGRIDLGLGRAPGTDQPTARALRRYFDNTDAFPQDVLELLGYFEPAKPGQQVRAVPGAGIEVPVWLLGSSLFGAQLAAQLGLPYAFASHFAPDAMDEALALYRRDFRPSARLQRPYAMLGLNVVAADSDAAARRLFTTQQQTFINLRRGKPGLVPPPIDDIEAYWTPPEKLMVERALACTVVGAADTVKDGIAAFIARHRPDELLLTANVFEHAARRQSFEIAAAARDRLGTGREPATDRG